MPRHSFADVDCAVAQAAEQVGDKWTLVILRNAFQGMTRFDDFIEHLDVASNVLAARLRSLVEAGILERRPAPGDARAADYKLTPKGQDLLPLIVFLHQWGERWMGRPRAPRVALAARKTGRPLRPVCVLADDGKALSARETVFRMGPARSDVLLRSQEIVARRRGTHAERSKP